MLPQILVDWKEAKRTYYQEFSQYHTINIKLNQDITDKRLE